MTEVENMSNTDLKKQLALSASAHEKFEASEDCVTLSKQARIDNFEHDFFEALYFSTDDVKYVKKAEKLFHECAMTRDDIYADERIFTESQINKYASKLLNVVFDLLSKQNFKSQSKKKVKRIYELTTIVMDDYDLREHLTSQEFELIDNLWCKYFDLLNNIENYEEMNRMEPEMEKEKREEYEKMERECKKMDEEQRQKSLEMQKELNAPFEKATTSAK